MHTKQLTTNTKFWNSLETLVAENQIQIDRPKGSRHPRFPEFIYPLNYGFLRGTHAPDGVEMDIWLGEQGAQKVCGILCTVDLDKKDSEIKILFGCSQEEMEMIYHINNHSVFSAILIERDS